MTTALLLCFIVVTLVGLTALPSMAASAGCGQALTNNLTPGATTPMSLVTSGDSRNRTFLVRTPSGYNVNNPTPLVLAFHGYGGTGALAQATYTPLDTLADANTFITVYPDGVDKSWNAGGCCGYAVLLNVDDVGFVRALVSSLESQLCVNSSRIYATGLSNGAFLSHRLACNASDIFAAVAPVEGSLIYCPCLPTKPVSIMLFEGNLDVNIPFDGGYGCPFPGSEFPTIPSTMNAWLARGQCACTFENASCHTNYLTQADGICTGFGACASGANVVYCNITDGGHAWSGGSSDQVNDPGCSAAVGTFSASTAIWNFFAANPKISTPLTEYNTTCPPYSLPCSNVPCPPTPSPSGASLVVTASCVWALSVVGATALSF